MCLAKVMKRLKGAVRGPRVGYKVFTSVEGYRAVQGILYTHTYDVGKWYESTPDFPGEEIGWFGEKYCPGFHVYENLSDAKASTLSCDVVYLVEYDRVVARGTQGFGLMPTVVALDMRPVRKV